MVQSLNKDWAKVKLNHECISKPTPNAHNLKPKPKLTSKPKLHTNKVEPKPKPKTTSKSNSKPQTNKVEPKPKPEPSSNSTLKPEINKVETNPKSKPKPKTNTKPNFVQTIIDTRYARIYLYYYPHWFPLILDLVRLNTSPSLRSTRWILSQTWAYV